MKIHLSPQRRDDTLSVIKEGDILTINGINYDFNQLPDGGVLPLYTEKDEERVKNIDCEYIMSDVSRVDGELELTLLLPYSANASEEARFPKPIIDPANGEVELPK